MSSTDKEEARRLVRQGLRAGLCSPLQVHCPFGQCDSTGTEGHWCLPLVLYILVLTFCYNSTRAKGGSGPQRLTRALGVETGNTPTGIPEVRCSSASTLSLALPNPHFPLLITRRQMIGTRR